MYTVKLLRSFGFHQDCYGVFGKTIKLPFVPSVGMGLGLIPNSDFCYKEERIEKTMYLVEKDFFLVQLEHSPGKLDLDKNRDVEFIVNYLVKDGWRFESPAIFNNLEECRGCEESCVVEVEEGFYCLNEAEVRLLELEGTVFKLHTKN